MGQPAAAPRRHDRLRIRPHEADQTGLDGALRVGRDRPEMVAVATGDVADAGFPRPGYGLGRAPAADHGAEPVVAVDHGDGTGRPVVADVRIGLDGPVMVSLYVGTESASSRPSDSS